MFYFYCNYAFCLKLNQKSIDWKLLKGSSDVIQLPIGRPLLIPGDPVPESEWRRGFQFFHKHLPVCSAARYLQIQLFTTNICLRIKISYDWRFDNRQSCPILLPNFKVQKYMTRPLSILSRKILPAHWLEDRDDYIENAGLIIMTLTIIIIVTRAVLLHCFGDIGCMIACKD